jgi:hypothetical protein
MEYSAHGTALDAVMRDRGRQTTTGDGDGDGRTTDA